MYFGLSFDSSPFLVSFLGSQIRKFTDDQLASLFQELKGCLDICPAWRAAHRHCHEHHSLPISFETSCRFTHEAPLRLTFFVENDFPEIGDKIVGFFTFKSHEAKPFGCFDGITLG
jgi:hypothetical protein